MSKGVKRVLKNSFFQTFGAFGITGFNFLLSLGYARFLGPERYGSLVTSQAQVLVFTLLVDLGLSQSLIGTLTSAENGKSELSRQGFRARDLLYRVLAVRLLGATLGLLGVFFVASYHNPVGSSAFWQDLAFTPHLFGFVFQQTGISLAMYRHRQGLSVLAYLLGVMLSVLAALFLAWKGVGVGWLLFAQALGGFLTGGLLLGFFLWLALRKKQAGDTRRLERSRGGHWGRAAWAALAKDAWPYAITAGVFVLWQRLDQIVASRFIGLEAGGQYALAVRLVGAPILVATSVCFAIFPDLQRIGLDAPERVKALLGVVLKLIWRYGILAGAAMLAGLALIVVPLVPKFVPAVKLLPWFVPGLWAFWMQSFLINALFGLRRYHVVVKTHLLALGTYVLTLPPLALWLGLPGVVWGFNIFCFSMAYFGFRAARGSGILPAGYLPWSAYRPEERQFLDHALSLRRRGAGSGA